MPNRVPAVGYTEARHLSMRTSLSSAGISFRTLMEYPSYARNRARALPSPSPFHYVTVGRTVARSHGRTVVGPNLFGLVGYYHFV